MRRTLIIKRCFSYCWAVLTQTQGLLCFSHHLTSEQTGHGKEFERGQSWDSWPQLTKGIFHAIWQQVHLIKQEEEGRRGWSFRVIEFCSPGNHYTQWSPAFPEMAKHLPADNRITESQNGRGWKGPLWVI